MSDKRPAATHKPRRKRQAAQRAGLGPHAPRDRERFAARAATLTLGGLALVGTGSADLGAVVTLLGLGTLFFAVHRYGRLGPEV